MSDTEQFLPKEILAKSVLSGREYGWRREDITSAITAAATVGLANVGGEVQFVLPEGTCELYWLGFGCHDRGLGEPWDEYVSRSARETLASLENTLSQDLIRAGIQNFAILCENYERGVDIERYLLFIAYFMAKEDA